MDMLIINLFSFHLAEFLIYLLDLLHIMHAFYLLMHYFVFSTITYLLELADVTLKHSAFSFNLFIKLTQKNKRNFGIF